MSKSSMFLGLMFFAAQTLIENTNKEIVVKEQ